MNRRGFLSMFGAAAAAAVGDPERLLWTPGAKLISVPAVRLAEASGFSPRLGLPAFHSVVSAGFYWRSDEHVLTTLATPEELAAYLDAHSHDARKQKLGDTARGLSRESFGVRAGRGVMSMGHRAGGVSATFRGARKSQ